MPRVASTDSDVCSIRVHPGMCLCRCIKPLCLWKFACFLYPVSDSVQLCPCSVMNVMPLCPGCEHHPSLGLQMQKVSAQHYFPVKGCWSFWSTSCLHGDHPAEVKQKTGIAKSYTSSCLIKHTHFNPSEGEQLLALAVQLEYFWKHLGSRETVLGSWKHTGSLLATKQFVIVCHITTLCGQNCGVLFFYLWSLGVFLFACLLGFFCKLQVLYCSYSLSHAGIAKLLENRLTVNTIVSTMWVVPLGRCWHFLNATVMHN